MSIPWKRTMIVLFALVLGVLMLTLSPAQAAGEVALFTPYKNITVSPGESIRYSIEVMNNTNEVQNVSFSVSKPQNWEVELTAGGWDLGEIGVKPGESSNVNLKVDVPLQVDIGQYDITVTAQGMATLPLKINIAEQGTFRTELTSDQPNMEGHADSTFNYSLDLRNRTADEQTYALQAAVDRGWNVTFTVSGQQVTSATVDATQSQTVSVRVTPPQGIEAGTYTIPIRAANNVTSAELELEVVITGSYNMRLAPAEGRPLSGELTAGKNKTVELEVHNTGTAELNDIRMDYVSPAGWEVSFEPNTIEALSAGDKTKVIATIQSSDQALPGDYVTGFTASTPEASADANYRITVKTSVLWGWLGIVIILAVIAGIYYLFRKYGRR